MNQIKLRKAKVGEEAAIHEVHMRSIREICVRDHGPAEVSGWGNRPLGQRWQAALAENRVWVVECDGLIKGVGYLKHDVAAKKGFLHALYFTPEVAGRGLGREMMELILAEALADGLKIIELESTLTAQNFYLKLGFTVSGAMKVNEIGGSQVRSIPMILTL